LNAERASVILFGSDGTARRLRLQSKHEIAEALVDLLEG